MREHYIGLMSGTSLDGVDGVLMAFEANHAQVLTSASTAMPPDLRTALAALNQSGPDELHRASVAGHGLAQLYAEVVQRLLQQADMPASAIRAIGAHGQTVRHAPPGPQHATPYTIQLNQPAWLAERTGIAVVADFRSRDIAAGGQGAPLVPAFHKEVFGQTGRSVAVANIGGIANLTALPADGRVLGLDTGPGNALMDEWCQRHTGHWYDAGGAWAANGTVAESLLGVLLAEPYFQQTGVKSTGRDLFHAAWLDRHLAHHPGLNPADVQATLLQLTARTLAAGVQGTDWRGQAPETLLVCGGGALNHTLMAALRACLPGMEVETTARLGWPIDQVEAAAFAWLARRCVQGLAGNEPQVTGARGPRVLGAIYPA
ncbi:anhydro-N-acetylmuramic acid kinase [Macromonas nakdongensis]|uniref:anhydro-N-acetylmuramic acid kinase n=1 Tax=Macromonas nakdongensis TaxID=1843082 RepID=UPI000C3281AF|nr:anhydro-N-acetylmuramic acid kinase [Macromonas nakdongensis]